MNGFIGRAEWGARNATSTAPLSRLDGWVAHWEGPHLGITRHEQCLSTWRGIQRAHMSASNSDRTPWADIAYSFGYCSHGYIFEGRGWHSRPAANGTTAANANYLAFCYIGGEGDPFTVEAQRALVQLNDECVKRGGRQRWPHSEFRATSCAGVTIDRFIKGDMRAALSPAARDIPIVLIHTTRMEDAKGDVMQRVDYQNVMLGDGKSTDDGGKGWVWCDIPHDKIVSIRPHGMFPKVDGYGHPVPRFASQIRVDEGHQSVIQIDGGAPSQVVSFSVWAVE